MTAILLIPVLGYPVGTRVRVANITDDGAVVLRIGGYYPVVSFDDIAPDL